MVAYATRNSAGRTYYYYRCSTREPDTCSNMRHRPAQALEKMVMVAIANSFQPHAWESFVRDLCDRKLEDLNRLGRSNPGKTREGLVGRIRTLETKIYRARDLFIDGDFPRPEYEEKKATLQEEIELVQKELSKTTDLDDEIKRVEDLRRLLLAIENPLSGHYVFTEEGLTDMEGSMIENGFGYGSKETAAKRRQEFYRRVGMRVKVGEELEISLGIGGPLISNLKTVSQAVLDQHPADDPRLYPWHSPCRVGHREILKRFAVGHRLCESRTRLRAIGQ
jgi:hypothetical protein